MYGSDERRSTTHTDRRTLMRRCTLAILLLLFAAHAQAALRRCDNRVNTPNRYIPCEVFTTFNVPAGLNAYTALEVSATFANPALAAPIRVYGYLEAVSGTT